MKQKNIVIGIMCITVCIMVIGFAAFSTTLNINGTSSIQSNWSVVFTNIQELSKTNGVTINNPPTASGTTATFDVDLESPGDSIEYQITVENKGTLDAIIESINASETGSDAIKFEINNIRVGDILLKKQSTTFKIKISYDEGITSQPNITTNKLTVNIDYVQNVGQTINPSEPVIKGPTLVDAIFRDNVAQSDASIDFSQVSSDTNGKGLYYTSTNTEDNRITYYFRGAVENNYIYFANYYWRIVRINEDGSVRLIYQGTTPTATGSEATIGNSAFNNSYNDNAYVGYMYGEIGASTYEETHANTNDSTIKGVIDAWYEDNLINYSSYLADAGFCGDRSIASGAGSGYGSDITVYGNNNLPQFACPQSNDLYTTSTSDKGNKALEYSIGLIASDEVSYAGGLSGSSNTSYYLYTGASYWTMSPWAFDIYTYSKSRNVSTNGGLDNSLVVFDFVGTRPVINLKSSVEITSGTGTVSNPYVIKTS